MLVNFMEIKINDPKINQKQLMKQFQIVKIIATGKTYR